MVVDRANGGSRCRTVRATRLGIRLPQPERPAVPLSRGRRNSPVEPRWQLAFPAPNGSKLPRLRMTRSSSPQPHPKWAHDPVGHMRMAPPLVPSLIVRPARPHRGLAALPRRRWLPAALGQAPAPAINPALDRAIKLGPAPVAALAAEAEQAVVAGPALVLATLPVLAAAINPAVVGTNSRFGGE